MMRAMVVSNVLSRREGTVLFVPVNGQVAILTVKRSYDPWSGLYGFATAR